MACSDELCDGGNPALRIRGLGPRFFSHFAAAFPHTQHPKALRTTRLMLQLGPARQLCLMPVEEPRYHIMAP